MHPRLTELLDYIDQQTGELRAAFDAVPLDRRAVRPGADRWSPVEVIGHLVIVDRRQATRFETVFEQAAALPPERDSSPVLPTINLSRVLDRTQKVSAPEPIQPKDPNPASVWSEFEDSRRALCDVIARADGLALSEVSMPHPLFGSLNMYEWIAFVGAHTARHAAQIREVVA